MFFRSVQAKWFETYVPREETVFALEALASSGQVALESDQKLAYPMILVEIREAVDEYKRLTQRYGDLLQYSAPSKYTLVRAPERMAKDALRRLNKWRTLTDQLLGQKLELEKLRQNMLLLLEYLIALQGASFDIARLSHQTQFLYKGLFACPKEQRLEAALCAAVDEYITGDEHNFFVVADLPENQAIVEKSCQAESCLNIEVPDWLSTEPAMQLSQVKDRLGELDKKFKVLTQKLEEERCAPQVVAAVQTMSLLSWFLENAETLSTDQKLCHVTGWTTAQRIEELQQALK